MRGRSLPFVAALAGCTSPAASDAPLPTDTSEGSGASTGGSTDGDTAFDPTMTARLDLPPLAGSSTGDTDGTCTSFTAAGEVSKQPADIIFVVDNSPSMLDEAHAVRDNLNAFSEQIVDAGIDIRVLLLTAYPDPSAAPEVDTGVCIEPPLGGGGCPASDLNLPIFAHLPRIIGSVQALSVVLDSHESWSEMMRHHSGKHVIVISDDDSFLGAEDFDAQFLALDPVHAGYAFHGIVATELCPEAGAIGSEYIALAELTGGVIGDLCQQQFQPLFDQLSTAVLEGSGLACTWPMPAAPAGKTIDPDSVEVRLAIDGVQVDPFHFQTAAGCSPGVHGWYYDDNAAPTELVACPATCEVLSTGVAADLEIDVGCASNVAG